VKSSPSAKVKVDFLAGRENLFNKLFSVFLAEPVADITAVLITTICFTTFYKKTLTSTNNIDNKLATQENTSIN
jgi:hypothetical protein